MQIKYVIFVLFVGLCSCKQDEPKVAIFKTTGFCLIDTTDQANKFLNYFNCISGYPIYYIGPKSDTIKIGRRYMRDLTKWKDYKIGYPLKYSDSTLKIFVDTSIKTNSTVEYMLENYKILRDSSLNYPSFLLTITNISDSIISMGRTFCLFYMNREAKNKKGNWVKIEEKLSDCAICLTGEPYIILKPKEIIISKVKRCRGSFVTDFRLVFGYGKNIVYSNTFRDSIDERTLQYSTNEGPKKLGIFN